ncbi:Disease resistance protein RPV1, partial [Cucurbita argyrosperma subsp. sororia]
MNQFKYERSVHDLEHWLPTEVRYLKWDRFPMEFLPLSSQHNNLIGLHMCHSNLKQFWLGNKHLKNLKASMADDSPIIGVPLLATLFSLTKLNLSYCNLKSIPEGIECLVSLTELNLSGNKFSQLPTTISQLQNLKRLNLNRCKKLLCIPELPPRILRILSKDCGSLVSIPEMLKTEQLYFMTELNLMNCYQLGGNKKLQRLIVSWMQSMLLRNGAFNVMIPGSEIPDWFTTKMGSSITVEWDPTARNSNLIRFALCVVCGGGGDDRGGDVSGSIIASVAGRSPDEGNLKKGDVIVNGLTISGMRKMDHIWLFVLARTQLVRRKMKGFREIEFRFLLQVNYGGSVSRNIELKRCGVGFINMEEEEEAMKRYAACIILNNKMRM